jgi:hypothetical protein
MALTAYCQTAFHGPPVAVKGLDLKAVSFLLFLGCR